jgi:hypothetical protein
LVFLTAKVTALETTLGRARTLALDGCA